MNPVAVRLTHAVMIVAALAAIVIVAPAQAVPEVVVLPKVQVTGKRANLAPLPVVRLEQVVVIGRRDDAPLKAVLVALR